MDRRQFCLAQTGLVKLLWKFTMRIAVIAVVTSIACAVTMLGDAIAQVTSPPPLRAVTKPAPAGTPDGSGYCVSGSAGFLSSEDQGIAESRSKCKRGDSVIIPTAHARIIARLCDFTKSIVPAGGNVVCVLTGADRPER